MYTLISIFYISFIGMAFMIFMKRREIVDGKQSIVSRVGAGSDQVLQNIFVSIKRALSYINKHTFIAIAHWVAFHVLVRVRKVYVEIKDRSLSNPHGKRLIDAVRGRGEVTNHGASFYLRRISK